MKSNRDKNKMGLNVMNLAVVLKLRTVQHIRKNVCNVENQSVYSLVLSQKFLRNVQHGDEELYIHSIG